MVILVLLSFLTVSSMSIRFKKLGGNELEIVIDAMYLVSARANLAVSGSV